ncbi:MAG: 30S ribosomal protein S1 [Candidatus Parcubacteria bacterium]|nr:MAG: 30S ribosomal protein S1 [Candidatus Parcubacteria bacterium]
MPTKHDTRTTHTLTITDANVTATIPLPPAQAAALERAGVPPRVGDVVEGTVIAKDTNKVFLDLAPWGTGIIYGREYLAARDVLRRVKMGDTVTAQVVEEENEEGYIEFSLKEARRAMLWAEAEQAVANRQIFELVVKDANKGGLLLEWQGIPGFLPASQLTPEHYPRVEDGDKDKILQELQKLVGQKLRVSILAVNQEDSKLIFTERAPEAADVSSEASDAATSARSGGSQSSRKRDTSLLAKYEVGQEIEGEVTGVVDFGVFIKIEEGLEGLTHLSELDWGLVSDPRKLFKVGDRTKAKIIEIKDGKVSLSIKRLTPDPWEGAKNRYHKGDKVNAVIIKYNKHGALASVEEGVAGLVHVSEFPSEEVLRHTLKLGEKYPFVITVFEPKDRRMILSYAGEKPWLTEKDHNKTANE